MIPRTGPEPARRTRQPLRARLLDRQGQRRA